MTLKHLTKLANIAATAMNTKIEDLYTEDYSTDAGFDLENGYGYQYAPYCTIPHLVHFYDEVKGVLTPCGAYKTADLAVAKLSTL